MKTFKLVSLQIEKDSEILHVPLEDGLIINKEDERNTWLIEAYTDQEHYDYFQALHENKTEVVAQAIITKKENDPAFFQMIVCSVKLLTGHVSVLLQGTMKRIKSDYAELLLEDLLSNDPDSEQLLAEFKQKMKTRPLLPSGKNDQVK